MKGGLSSKVVYEFIMKGSFKGSHERWSIKRNEIQYLRLKYQVSCLYKSILYCIFKS